MLRSSVLLICMVVIVMIISFSSVLADGRRESAYQFVKRRAACLNLGGDIDQSNTPPYQNWFDHVIFGNSRINVSVSAYLHGVGPLVHSSESISAINEGLHTFGMGLQVPQLHQERSQTRSSTTTTSTPHYQEVMRRMNTTLPVYAGLCGEDDEVHHLRTMQCVGMLGLTSSSSLSSFPQSSGADRSSGVEDASSPTLSSSSKAPLTAEERKANHRKRAVAKTLYGGGPGSEMSASEGALRQQLWCRALLTCDGGRNGFIDLCAHVISPIERMRQDALALITSSTSNRNKNHYDIVSAGGDGGGYKGTSEPSSATVLVRHRLLRTQERRRLQERREEREFEEEDAAEEARNRIVQASRQYYRERPGEGDDLLSISSKSALADDSNSAESFLVY